MTYIRMEKGKITIFNFGHFLSPLSKLNVSIKIIHPSTNVDIFCTNNIHLYGKNYKFSVR